MRVTDNNEHVDHSRAGNARNHGDGHMRTRAFRRHQASRHMWRRLKEDRNQHYNELAVRNDPDGHIFELQ